MSFRQLTHHRTPFRSIRAACDGGRAASAQDSAREPERESAQEPEREAAAEAAEAAVWAQHGTRYTVLLPTPGDAAEAARAARRHRSSEAGRRRPSRRTR